MSLRVTGTGTSLREAINLANATSGAVIVFSRPMTVALDPDGTLGPLPVLTSDTAIVADGNVAIDGTSLPSDANLGDCLWISGGDSWLIGLELFSCKDDAIRINNTVAPPRVNVRDCYVHHCADRAVLIYAPDAVIGPGNELAFNGGDGVAIRGTEAHRFTIRENLIHDNGADAVCLVDPDTYVSGDSSS